MRKILLTVACLIMLVASYTTSQDQIKISINKNEKGEMMFNVSGHTAPVVLEVNGKAVTVNVGQSEVNMEREFGFASFSSKTSEADIATAAGTETAAGGNAVPDTQAPIPPVMAAVNPPLATPY